MQLNKQAEPVALRLRTPNCGARIILAAIVIAFVIAATAMSHVMNIWLDEAYSMYTTGSTFANAIKIAISFEEQPPVYFAALNLWRKIHPSIFFARVFSILCILFAAYFLYRLVRDFSQNASLYFLAVFFSSPHTLWAATEIRTYALSILLSSILFWSFYEIFIKRSNRITYKFIFIFVSVLSLYTQYFIGVVHIFNLLFLLLLRDWKAIRGYGLYMIMIGICFTPFFIGITSQQVYTSTSGSPRSLSIISSIICAAKLILNDIISGNDSFNTLFKWAKAAIIGIGISGCWVMRRRTIDRILLEAGIRSFISIVVGIPLFAGIVYLLGSEDYLAQRYVLFLVPELLVIVVFAIMNIRVPLAKWTVATLLVLYNITNCAVEFYPMRKNGDWKNVARIIEQQAQPNEPIFVYTSWDIMPLSYYLNNSAKLIPIPHPPKYNSFDLKDIVIDDDRIIDRAVRDGLKNAESCWFVVRTIGEYRNIHLNAHLLPEFIKRTFAIDLYERLFGTDIYHVSRH